MESQKKRSNDNNRDLPLFNGSRGLVTMPDQFKMQRYPGELNQSSIARNL